MRNLSRVIVTGRVSKHHVFAFADPQWLIADGVVIFLKSDAASLAVLQSAIHAEWVQRHKTTMRLDTTYSVSRCFSTFPWPDILGDELESVGQLYLDTRNRIQARLRVGLTSIYNGFHDEADTGTEMLELRDIHRRLDTIVAASFGIDIPLEHGSHDTKQGRRFAISPTARMEVIGQLLALNRKRYEEEVAQGLNSGTANRSPARASSKHRATDAEVAEPAFDFDCDSPAAPRDTDPSAHILDFLKTHRAWHAKADILAATGLTDGQWNAAIADLVARGLIERQGERRGARYRSKGGER